jgi:uncharacterized protein
MLKILEKINILKKKDENKKIVILDTNILLLPGQVGVDIYTEIDKIMTFPYEFCVIEDSIKELQKIIDGNPKKSKDKFNAKLAFIMVKQKGLKVLNNSANTVDDTIVDLSNSNVFVATQDKQLQKRVEERGAKLLLLRQQKYFVVK